MLTKTLKFFLPVIIFISLSVVSFAEHGEEKHAETETHKHEHDHDHEHAEAKPEKFNAGTMIMHHISDAHEWHIIHVAGMDVALPLPVILYNYKHGFSFFSYSKFEHGHAMVQKDGVDLYRLNEKHKIETLDGSGFFDFSITKNVLAMIMSSLILFIIMRSVANRYKKGSIKAPNGLQNLVEVLITFVRDEIVKPMLGRHTNKYLPYLLTIFFFIWINNMLGLLPSAANVTGNIAVTMVLALFTWVIMMFSSGRHYWMHIINPPGVPHWVKIILVPVELLGAFVTKPFTLMIRLFANMTAGHLIVLSFLSLIFIFAEMNKMAGYGISIFSIAFSTFIYLLELLVAALQAYIFTNLSALFIAEAIGPDHDSHGSKEHH